MTADFFEHVRSPESWNVPSSTGRVLPSEWRYFLLDCGEHTSFLINMVVSSVNSYFRSTSSTEVSWYLFACEAFLLCLVSFTSKQSNRASLRNQYLSRSLFCRSKLELKTDLVRSCQFIFLARLYGKGHRKIDGRAFSRLANVDEEDFCTVYSWEFTSQCQDL